MSLGTWERQKAAEEIKHSMPYRMTKFFNRLHKRRARDANIAQRRAANQARSSSASNPCFAGIVGPPGPFHPGNHPKNVKSMTEAVVEC